jgi:MFS family permease
MYKIKINPYYLLTIITIAAGSIPKGPPLCAYFPYSPTSPSILPYPPVSPSPSAPSPLTLPSGYDEGGFSASITLKSFTSGFNLSPKSPTWLHNPSALASRKANIASLGVLGAALGSLLSIPLNDRLGRLLAWRVYVLIWASGITMQVFSSRVYRLMLFARVWGGLGAGALTVVAPLFLSKIASARKRGGVVGVYMVVLLSVLSLGRCCATVMFCRWR